MVNGLESILFSFLNNKFNIANFNNTFKCSINDGVLFCGESDGSKDYDTILDERSKIDKNFIKASRLMISITQEEKEIHRFEEIDSNKSLTLSHGFNCGIHWLNEDEYNDLNARIDIEVLGKTQFDKAIDFFYEECQGGYELHIEDGEEEFRKIAQEIKDNIPYKNKVYLETIWHSANRCVLKRSKYIWK